MPRVSIADPSFSYDPSAPEGYRSGGFRLGPVVGSRDTGATVYELPPQRRCRPRTRGGPALSRAGAPTALSVPTCA